MEPLVEFKAIGTATTAEKDESTGELDDSEDEVAATAGSKVTFDEPEVGWSIGDLSTVTGNVSRSASSKKTGAMDGTVAEEVGT